MRAAEAFFLLAGVIFCMERAARAWDLDARFFGLLLGAAGGLAGACVAGTLFAVLKRSLRKMVNGVPDEKSSAESPASPACRRTWCAFFASAATRVASVTASVTASVAAWVLTGMLAAYFLGAFFDWEYFSATQAALNGQEKTARPTFFLVSVFTAVAILAVFILRIYGIMHRQRPVLALLRFTVTGGTLLLMLGGIYAGMTSLARPNTHWRPVELESGIYIYANDTVYNLSPLNIYSSRMRGFTHTGICLVTRTPEEVNARRAARGWKPLRFEKLDHGYYINDVNLDVRDRDGLANHGSRTSLSDISFPFDLAGFNHYLAGRSTNDRLKPAVTLAHVDVPNPEEAWQDVIRFRDDFNEKYPDGFIYSPVPYRAKYMALYNCNTVIAAVAGETLHQGDKYDFITAIPLCFGRQTAADGKRMLDEFMAEDRTQEVFQQRNIMEKGGSIPQPFHYRLLHKNGWLHRLTGDIREP